MDCCRSIGGVFLMVKELKPGDRVQWNTPQGKTTGKVKKKLTSSKKIKGSPGQSVKRDPEYLFQSEKAGKEAAHKAGELLKIHKRSR
jgi:Hypervirulence associated proteins TUDOR domain